MPTYHSIKFSFAWVLGFQQESDVTRNPFRRYVEILFLNGKKAIRQAMHTQRPSEALAAFGVVCGGHTCVSEAQVFPRGLGVRCLSEQLKRYFKVGLTETTVGHRFYTGVSPTHHTKSSESF